MIYHITSAELWQETQANSVFQSETLDIDGFIHCSTSEQILGVANDLFRGQTELVILAIDESRITSPIKYEDLYETGLLYPHIYGVIPGEAITMVIDFPPNADGLFALPKEIEQEQ